MNTLRNSCPCCGTPLLRHARQGGLYWFCTYCRQDMPFLSNHVLHRDPLVVNSKSRVVQTLNS